MPGLRNLVPPIFSCILLLSSSCAPTEDEVITADNVKREGSPGVFLDSAVGGVDYYTSSARVTQIDRGIFSGCKTHGQG